MKNIGETCGSLKNVYVLKINALQPYPRGKMNVLNCSKMESLLELVASGFSIVYSVSRDCISSLKIFLILFFGPLTY